jgi:hypothetical protein
MNYAMKKLNDQTRARGGKRKGAGRKTGFKMPKSKLKEKTKVMRIPIGIVPAVEKLIDDYEEFKKAGID